MNCEGCREYLIDYIEKNISMENSAMVHEHLEHCSECRKELRDLQSIVYELGKDSSDITIPEGFMNNLRIGKPKVSLSPVRVKKRPKNLFLAAAITFAMSITIVLLNPNLVQNLINRISPAASFSAGEKLNISRTYKNIKITVTDVVADDLYTFINYTIEDTTSEKRHFINNFDDITIKERWGNTEAPPQIDMYISGSKDIVKGRIILLPINTHKKTIHLSFSRLHLYSKDSVDTIEGNWAFEIPIKKYESKTFEIDQTIHSDSDRYTIDIDKLIIAPTATKLYFNCRGGDENERIHSLQDLSIIADGKEYNSNINPDAEPSLLTYGSNDMIFESIYSANPKNIEIKIRRMQSSFEAKREFTIDLNKSTPQEFDYLGSKITISNLKVADTISFDLTTPSKNAEYENLICDFSYVNKKSGDSYFSIVGNYSETNFIDKEGNKYPFGSLSWQQQRSKNAVLYTNKTQYLLTPSDKTELQNAKTINMIVDGYVKTKFLDASVLVELKKP